MNIIERNNNIKEKEFIDNKTKFFNNQSLKLFKIITGYKGKKNLNFLN